MATTMVLTKIVVWIAVLQEKDTEKAGLESEVNALTFPCVLLFCDIPMRSYKVCNLQQRRRN